MGDSLMQWRTAIGCFRPSRLRRHDDGGESLPSKIRLNNWGWLSVLLKFVLLASVASASGAGLRSSDLKSLVACDNKLAVYSATITAKYKALELESSVQGRRDSLVMAILLDKNNMKNGQFLAWIRGKVAVASSEDMCQYYDHLKLLARFQAFNSLQFSIYEKLAKRYESVDKNVRSVDVKEVQAKLNEEWRSLSEAIQKRHNKLESAGEISQFNGEKVSREKDVQNHLRKHEGFEHELKLQVLIDDSAYLQFWYPGENVQNILKQMALQAWNMLQEKVMDRQAFHYFTHKSLPIENDVARVEEYCNKLKNSQMSLEALCVKVVPARGKYISEIVPSEVNK